MSKNRNRHKSKEKIETSNTLGDIMKLQGINLKELKVKLNGKEKANKKAV